MRHWKCWLNFPQMNFQSQWKTLQKHQIGFIRNNALEAIKMFPLWMLVSFGFIRNFDPRSSFHSWKFIERRKKNLLRKSRRDVDFESLSRAVIDYCLRRVVIESCSQERGWKTLTDCWMLCSMQDRWWWCRSFSLSLASFRHTQGFVDAWTKIRRSRAQL